jgi:hypothetical protein
MGVGYGVMTEPPVVPKVLLDPSILFTDEALTWIADPEIRPSLVVSSALWERLTDPAIGELLAPFRVSPDPDRVGRLRDALAEIDKFSYQDVEMPSEEARAVRDALLAGDEPLPEVLADEWVFLASQSIAIVSVDARTTLDAFRRAGGQVFDVSNRVMRRGLRRIRKSLPPWLLKSTKAFGRFRLRPRSDVGKLLVFGGQVALILLPHVGLALTIGQTIQTGTALIVGDP